MPVVLLTAPTILLSDAATTANVNMPSIAAGSGRVVIVSIEMYSGASTASSPTAVTCNGVAGLFIAGDTSATVRERAAMASYIFIEADIATISGQSIVSNGGTGSVKSIDCTVFSGAKQSAPSNFNNAYASSGTLTMPLTRANSSITYGRSFSQITGTTLTLANPTRTGEVAYPVRRVSYAIATDTAGTSDFTSSTNVRTTAHVFNIESTPSQLINSTNSGADDLNAGAVNTAGVTGYVVGVNPVVSGTVGSLVLTSVSQATTIATFTIPAPVNDSYYPQPDTSHTLTLTDGSNPATFNAVMNSLAGYTSIVLASPDLADTHKIPYWLTSTAVNDDRIMYKTADMTVAADGGISGATLGATTIYYHWRVADSKIYAYEALLDEDGIATSTSKSYFIGLGIGIGF